MSRPVEPRPLKQHQAKTVFLRCPTPVWPLVSMGKITEFRCATGNAPQLWKAPIPTLAVVYRRQLSAKRYDYRLMVLEGIRREALGVVDEAGLAAAGYAGDGAFARFRRDWMIAEKKRFEPLRTVFVYTVRPVKDNSDLITTGAAVLNHLYGDYLAQEAQTRPRSIRAERRPNQAARLTGEAVAG